MSYTLGNKKVEGGTLHDIEGNFHLKAMTVASAVTTHGRLKSHWFSFVNCYSRLQMQEYTLQRFVNKVARTTRRKETTEAEKHWSFLSPDSRHLTAVCYQL